MSLLSLGLVLVPSRLPAQSLQSVALIPSRDATLYNEKSGVNFLNLANGAGDHLFAGRTGFDHRTLRRGLVWFDVASAVPAGATIVSARLDFNVSKSPPGAGAHGFTLHRATSAWGEGGSDAFGEEGAGTTAESGDATWEHSFFGSLLWNTPGGDFLAQASAASAHDPNLDTLLRFAGPGLAADVQAWLDGAPNHGWMLLGDESVAFGSARRFYSRNAGADDGAPVLLLDYRAVPEPATLPLLAAGLALLRRIRRPSP